MAPVMIFAEEIQIKRGSRVIVDKFSVAIEVGKIHALIGPNGSGKSSALSALSGDRDVYVGDIFIDDKRMDSLGIGKLALMRAVVAQSQQFTLSFKVQEVLKMATVKSGSDETIAAAVEAVDIASLLYRPVTSLSGGERQRVAIAMGLAQATPYLLLDEPFSAQDVESVERISSHLRQLADSGFGIFLVAHMSKNELAWCDDVTSFANSAS